MARFKICDCVHSRGVGNRPDFDGVITGILEPGRGPVQYEVTDAAGYGWLREACELTRIVEAIDD